MKLIKKVLKFLFSSIIKMFEKDTDKIEVKVNDDGSREVEL